MNTNAFVKLVNSFEHDSITKLHTKVNMKHVTNKAKKLVYTPIIRLEHSVCVCVGRSANQLQMFTCTVLVIYATSIVLIKTCSILNKTKLDDVDEINCDNFIFHYKNRKKLANHKSGGIALGFKKYLDKYIKYIQSDCQFVLWFSIDKKVLDLPKDAIFGIIYIPPVNTSYTSEDAFTEIEFELQNFCSKTNYIIMLGDFNSRTGNLSDFYNIDKDNSFENNTTDYNELNDVDVLDELGIPRLRNSIDTVVNGYGRKLIDFVKITECLFLTVDWKKTKQVVQLVEILALLTMR
ncbi:unnamed protein product [Mytilus edulis]|uniref:Endonuclease/exonuclease/phosphatase domain-containing protein n=1 Tax=Mytilus edulis TaxID=6550 RepID=A0A8S3TBR1_MYTED|nr:unnamed protein product [Mytilus edulis]